MANWYCVRCGQTSDLDDISAADGICFLHPAGSGNHQFKPQAAVAEPTNNWVKYDRVPFRHGGSKVIATLSGDAVTPMLFIGRYMLDAGFDVKKRYDIWFDAERVALGLLASADGFMVNRLANGKKTSIAYQMHGKGFCRRFKLNRRYRATAIEQEGEMWVLRLEVMEKL